MKCKDCKHWSGEQTTVGRECLHPLKKKMWDAKEEVYTKLGYRNPCVTARYKYASATACKQFEARHYKYKVNIEPCYMVRIVDEDGTVLEEQLSLGVKAIAHELGDRLLHEVTIREKKDGEESKSITK